MTAFDGLPAEERREWREHPVTKAFMALLAVEAARAAKQAVQSVRNENMNQAAVDAGKEDGLLRAIDLGERT